LIYTSDGRMFVISDDIFTVRGKRKKRSRAPMTMHTVTAMITYNVVRLGFSRLSFIGISATSSFSCSRGILPAPLQVGHWTVPPKNSSYAVDAIGSPIFSVSTGYTS